MFLPGWGLLTLVKANGDIRRAREAVASHNSLLGVDHPDTLQAMLDLSRLLMENRALPEAKQLQEVVYDARTQTLGSADYGTLRAGHLLGMTLQQLGDMDGAKALQMSVMKRMRDQYGQDDEATLAAMTNLAITLRVRGDLLELAELDAQILRTRETVYGAADRKTLQSMAASAATLKDLGDSEGAKHFRRGALTRAISRFRTRGPGDDVLR